MIRAVLDSNVIASGLPATQGTLATLFENWFKGQFELVLSNYILEEVIAAWNKPYWQARLNPAYTLQALDVLQSRSDIADVSIAVSGIASHPQDDLVLATALSGNADFIVTGDRELMRLRIFNGIKILSPREFLTRLDGASPS